MSTAKIDTATGMTCNSEVRAGWMMSALLKKEQYFGLLSIEENNALALYENWGLIWD